MSLYIGKYSKLYWMRTRMYDAEHGRFISPDRLGKIISEIYMKHITIFNRGQMTL